MSEAIKRASFAIEDMVQGGGNLWGSAGPVRGTVVGGVFTKESPYTSGQTEGNPIFGRITVLLNGEGTIEERTVSESYSLGATAGDNFEIAGDGDYLVPTNNDAHIVVDSKFGTLASSLQNEKVPKAILTDFQFSKLVGLDGDWKRIADKERTFAPKPGETKKKFPPSTLCLIKLHSMGVAVGKTNGAVKGATATSAPTTASTAAVDIDGAAFEVLTAVLKNGPVIRGRLTLAASKAIGTDEFAHVRAEKAAIARRIAEESYLKELAETGLVVYAATEKGQPVSLAQ